MAHGAASQWRRAASAGLAGLLVSSASIVSAGAVSGAVTGLRLASLSGRGLSRITLHAGGLDVVTLALEPSSAAVANAASSLRFHLPLHVSLRALDVVSESTGQTVSGWGCRHAELTVDCSLLASAAVSASVANGTGLLAYAELVNTLTPRVDAGPVSVSASLEGATPSTLSVPTSVAATNVPSLSLGRALTPMVAPGAQGSVEYQLTSAAAASPSGSITLSHPLPSAGVASWRNESPQWHCAGDPSSSPTCTYERSTPAGTRTRPLILTYRLARSTPSGTHAWISTLHVTGPYGLSMSRDVPSSITVSAHATAQLKVSVRVLGAQSVRPGARVHVAIVHQAPDGVPSGLTDQLIIPTGFHVERVNGVGWSCGPGTNRVTCSHPTPIVTSSPFGFFVTLGASSNAHAGIGVVAAIAAARDASARDASMAMLNVASSTSPAPAAHAATARAATAHAAGPPALEATPASPAVGSAGVSSSVGVPLVRSEVTQTPLTQTSAAPTNTALTSAPSRQSHATPSGTATTDSSASPRCTSIVPSSGTYGGFVVTIASSPTQNVDCSWPVTVNASDVSFSASLSFTDSSNWSIAVASNTTTTLLGVSGVVVSGSLSDLNNVISGSVTFAFTSLSVGGGVTLSGSLGATAVSSGTLTISGAATVVVNAGTSLAASFSYSNSNNWTVSVTSATFAIESANLSASGALSDVSGVISGSISASTTSPVTVVSGLTLSGSLAFTYSSTTSAGFSGSLTLGAAGLSLSTTFTYTNSTNWSAAVSAGASGSISIAPGITLPAAQLSGSVADAGGAITWNVTGSLGGVDLIANVLTLGTMSVSISNNCAVANTYVCPSNPNGVFVAFTASATLTVGSLVDQTLQVAAVYGANGNQFDLSASLSGSIDVVPSVISITQPQLAISYNDPSFTSISPYVTLATGEGSTGGFGFSLQGTISLSLMGSTYTLPVAMTYAGGGFAIAASFSEVPLSLGATGVNINVVAYTTASATLTLDSTTQVIPANTFFLAGSLTLPDWLNQLLSTMNISVGTLSVIAQYTSPSEFSISANLPMSIPIPSGSGDFTFTMGDLTFSAGVKAGSAFLTLAEVGQMGISASAGGGTAQALNITLALSGTTTEATFSISVNGVAPGAPAWSNAFGYPGLDLTYFTIQGGITFATGLPTFGLAGAGVLPSSITSDLGIGTGTNVPLSFALNLSTSTPCLAVAIGTLGGTPVINIGAGVLTAAYASFVAAPAGCSIGTTVIQPGFSIGFQGTFVGVAVTFNATLSVSPFSFTGDASVSGFSVGGFTLQNAMVQVSITPSSFSLAFSGGIELGSPSNQVQMSGSINSSGSFDLRGTAAITLAGFSLNVDVRAASVTFLGLHFAFVSGTANLDVAGSTLSLVGIFTNGSSGFQTQLSGTMNFSPGKFNLGSASFNLDVSPSVQSLSVSAAVNLGGVITGQLSGTLRQAGGQIGFNLSVAASLNLGPLASASGTLYVGNCTGSCTSIGPMSASLSGGLTWDGKTYTFSSVSVSPSWSFTFTSSGSVNVQSGVIDSGLFAYRASFAGNYYLYISSSSPYLSVAAGFRAVVQTAYGHLETKCSGKWYDASTWHCDTWVVWGGWNNTIDVGASMNTNGQFSATYGGRTYQVNF